MGTTAEELRYDIERQRMEVSRDLDALGDRVSPSRMVERRTDAVKGRFRGMRDAVMGSADDMSSSAHDRMGSMGDSAHGAMEAVSDTVSGVPDMARERTQGGLGLFELPPGDTTTPSLRRRILGLDPA